MYRHDDPRFRRTLNQITSNLESANESAQIGLFSFNEHYIKPCFSSFTDSLRPCLTSFQPCGEALRPCWESTTTCIEPCVAQCIPRARRDDRRVGRSRASTRGRLEHSFDFYDDWEEDENDALLALDDDEFERVVGGHDEHTQAEGLISSGTPSPLARQPRQPGRRRIFDYGSAQTLARRKSASGMSPYGGGSDPNVIPQQSYFGFLNKLPFGVGRSTLRYKPSAANLQDQPSTTSGKGGYIAEAENLLEGSEEADPDDDAGYHGAVHRRQRSVTTGSGHTTDSYSSRGDLFPSDEEADAIPIDDSFETELTRQVSSTDDPGNASKRNSRLSLPPLSRRTSKRSKRKGSGSRTSKSSSSGTPKSESIGEPEMAEQAVDLLPTLSDLKLEEDKAREEEDEIVEKKREAAARLAKEKGLSMSVDQKTMDDQEGDKAEEVDESFLTAYEGEDNTTEPFPAFDGEGGESRRGRTPTA